MLIIKSLPYTVGKACMKETSYRRPEPAHPDAARSRQDAPTGTTIWPPSLAPRPGITPGPPCHFLVPFGKDLLYTLGTRPEAAVNQVRVLLLARLGRRLTASVVVPTAWKRRSKWHAAPQTFPLRITIFQHSCRHWRSDHSSCVTVNHAMADHPYPKQAIISQAALIDCSTVGLLVVKP